VKTQNLILFSISNFGYDLKVIAIQVGITSLGDTLFVILTSTSIPKDEWILDSGASSHITPQLSIFSSLISLPNHLDIFTVDGSTIIATHHGSLIGQFSIPSVPHITNLSLNLFFC